MQLEEITSGRPWDFSHAPSQIIDVVEKQDCNIFLYGFPLTPNSHQAPVYAGILMPRNAGPPTNMMCVADNQDTSSEQLVSFNEFGYSWQQSADPDHNGQVYSLTCSKDFGSMSEEDSNRLEYGNLFMPYPELLSTNRDGKLNVETVHFSCTMLDGELDTGTWYPKEMNFKECIDGFVEAYYNYEDDLKKAGYKTDEEQRAKLAQVKADLIPVSLSKSYPPPHLLSIAQHNFLQYHILVSQILQAALARTRNQQQETNDLFFRSVDYDASILGAIGFITLFPINYPSDTVPLLPGAYMDKLWKQAGDGGTCRLVIDTHYPIEKSTFPQILHQLDPNYSFNITDPSSSARLLHVLSIIDFVFATSGFGSSNSNYDTTQFVDFLRNIVSNYGLNRIIKFIGQDSSGSTNIWNLEAKYGIYIKGLIREAEQSIAGVGRPPVSWQDHLQTTFDSPRSRRSQQLREVESIRFEEGSKMLQAKFVGEQTYRPISVKDLQSSASEAGTSRLILQAVCDPGRSQPIPAGSHVNPKEEEEEEEEKPNCFKESLLMSGVPSPSGHQRIRKSLPDEHEMSMPEFYSILDEKIKTVVVTKVKENIHGTAMTGQSDMIGVFYDEQRKHCVYINGEKGTISDPADGFPKDLPRSDDSLLKFGISEFSELYILSRKKGGELSDKSRKKFEEKLKLPFF